MGNRREPRKTVAVEVRIFGTDRDGKVFSESVKTIDVSRNGAKLGGLKANLRVDEIIGLTYGKNKVHFRVKWTGAPGTHTQGTVGLLNLTPEKALWDFPLPAGELDGYMQQRSVERRRWPRIKCSISVEIRPAGQAVIWGKASDLSKADALWKCQSRLRPARNSTSHFGCAKSSCPSGDAWSAWLLGSETGYLL